MTRVAIIAALPAELKPLVRGWPHSVRNGVHFWAQRSQEAEWEEEWIAACAGMGADAATRAFAALEDGGPISIVFSLGWAGAITFQPAPGQAYNLAGVIDARTGERFNCDAGAGDQWLVTSPRVADQPEKRRLASTYKAALVDMEAAAIARLALMREIPFYCIKGVSDTLDDRLPDFNPFIAPDGRFQAGKFALSVLVTPKYWPALLRMGENSKKAAHGIARTLVEFLDARGHTE